MNPKRSPAQILSAIFGFMMMAVSAPCVLAMLNDLFIVGTDNTTGALIIGTFMAFVGVAGLAMMVFGFKKPVERPIGATDQAQKSGLRDAFDVLDFEREIVSQDLEREVLKLARAHHGRLTVADIAVETDLRLDESKRLMEYMVRCDAAQTHLTDGGNVVYVFPGFATDKLSAVNPLDDMAMFDRELARSEENVVFDRGVDGHVALDLDDEADDEEQEVAAVQQKTQSEEW